MTWKITELSANSVRRALTADRRIGIYWLLQRDRDGVFRVRYVGRSLTCLKRRLLHHASNGYYEAFVFRLLEEVEEVWRAECREYHLFMPGLDNETHPNSPNHVHFVCPYCKFGRLESLAEDDSWVGGEA